MITANLYSETGEVKGAFDLPEALFGQPVHKQALFEAVRCYLANQRLGTHDTKTRSEVRASGGKLYRQKGTGRARAGSAQSPTRVGGGVAFGPHPRDYGYKVPKKVRRLALKSALADRAANERVHIVEDPTFEQPKTATAAQLLKTMALEGRHTLFVLPAEGQTLWKSFRNLKGVRTIRGHELNPYAVLWADNLVFTRSALGLAEEVFGS
jgi:large subunit ribosomal protein L4